MVIHFDRDEEGVYYAVDLGGTSFRVFRVEVGAGSVIINQKVEIQAIPEELMGTSEVLVLFHLLCMFVRYIFGTCL
jgi:hexokinase